MTYRKCDWIGCSEIGYFEGLEKIRLNDESKKSILAFLKFIYLCPIHLQVGVANLKSTDQSLKVGDSR